MADAQQVLEIILQGIDRNSPEFAQLQANLKETGITAETTTEEVAGLGQASDEAGQQAVTLGERFKGAMDVVREIRNVLGGMVITLLAVAQAFKQARDAAEEFGNSRVVDQIDTMHSRLNGLKEVILSMPMAGKSFLDWMGQAGETAGELVTIYALLIVRFKEFTGEVSHAQAEEWRLKIAQDATAESLDKLKAEIAGSVSDFDKLAQKIHFVGSTANLTASQIEYLNQRLASSGQYVGGSRVPVAGGQHGLVMTVPPGFEGDTYPVGASSGETVIIIPAGGGGRQQLIEFGELVAPYIARALGRAGSVPGAGNTRS